MIFAHHAQEDCGPLHFLDAVVAMASTVRGLSSFLLREVLQ